MTPTARTLKTLRDEGWTCAVVEHFNIWAKVRQDLFGGIDVLGVRPGETIGVQCCSGGKGKTGGDQAKHVKKLLAEPRMKSWVEAGNRLECWSWRKGAKGWTCRVARLTLVDGEWLTVEGDE